MGPFWIHATSEMISSLYACTLPSVENISSNLVPNETCPQDQRVFLWFNRYLRACSQRELMMLLRFVTGSTSLQPSMKIKVEFIDQPNANLRPCSKTCFQILILPRQYSSFTELKENLKLYINSSDNWTVHDKIFSSFDDDSD